MTTDDELQPNIVRALRDVSPADDAVRNMHIHNALNAMTSRQKRSRLPLISAAAAVIALVGGFVVAQSRSSDTPAFAQREVSTIGTVPAKGISSPATAKSLCATEGQQVVGTYQLDGETASLIDTGAGVSIATDNACEGATFLPYPPDRLSSGNATDCSPGNTWEMLLITHISDSQGFFYWIGMNAQYLEMWDCSTGTVVSQVAHPLVN